MTTWLRSDIACVVLIVYMLRVHGGPQGLSTAPWESNRSTSRTVIYLGNGLAIDPRLVPDYRSDTDFLLGERQRAGEALVQVLLHLKGPITRALQQNLQDFIGVCTLGDYIAQNTYLLLAPLEAVERAQASPDVLWIGHYRSYYKLSAGLLLLLQEQLPRVATRLPSYRYASTAKRLVAYLSQAPSSYSNLEELKGKLALWSAPSLIRCAQITGNKR